MWSEIATKQCVKSFFIAYYIIELGKGSFLIILLRHHVAHTLHCSYITYIHTYIAHNFKKPYSTPEYTSMHDLSARF